MERANALTELEKLLTHIERGGPLRQCIAQAREALTLLRETPPASTGQWLPIESAPKDGQWLLLTDGDECEICRWDSPYWELRGGGLFDATYWMPLPPAPSGETPSPQQEQANDLPNRSAQ